MKLLAVVVIYKMLPSQSSSLQSLLHSRDSLGGATEDIDILVWDNTPNGQAVGDLPRGVRYVSAPNNPGLSPAFNWALTIARLAGCDWFLTLDQDTSLPEVFLAQIADISDLVKDDPTVAAILPKVIGNVKQLSPFRFIMGAVPWMLPYGFVGISPYVTYAVNSAATLRVASLQQSGGYNPLFPLDISDIDLFHRIGLAGMSVYVAGDLVVSHDFSLLDKRKRMSLERYRSLLRDECAFWDLNMSVLGRAERLVRLAGRICKDFLRADTSGFQRITFSEIIRRLFTHRSTRIKTWRQWADSRRSSSINLGVDSTLLASSLYLNERDGCLRPTHFPLEP